MKGVEQGTDMVKTGLSEKQSSDGFKTDQQWLETGAGVAGRITG